MPDTAREFYSQAADLAAIPLKTLVTAVTQIERRLEVWSAQIEKQRRVEDYADRNSPKGTETAAV